jgi:hypothetical protein
MSKDNATKFDGISRPSNDLYKKNFDLIFKNKKVKKNNKKNNDSIKHDEGKK